MPRRGKRKRLARCIYESLTGRTGIYQDASGRQRELSFPPYTPLSEIREALRDAQSQNRGSGSARAEARGTLAAAIDTWAGLEQHLASWKERRAELRAWAALYPRVRLRDLSAHDVRAAMGIWTQDGIAPKTIRNRLWSLRHLYRVILGPSVSTPVDHVAPPPKTRTVPTHVAPELILTVYRNLLEQERKGLLRDAKTRARFMVRASTGRRPSEIMRAKPDDVDLERRVWRVRDGKGGWSEGLFLNDDMLMAWQLFAASKAWGEFNTGSMARVLRSAGWPLGVRPYAMRHSIGIDLSEGGADLADVGGWLGHTSVQTTRSIYVPVLNSRMERLSRQINGRLNGWSVPVTVPDSHAPRRSKLHQKNGCTKPSPKGKSRRKR